MMKFKYRPSAGFIVTLVMIGLLAKCNSDLFVPKTDLQIYREVESRLAYEAEQQERQLNTITDEEMARLPKFDSKKNAMIKLNNKFLVVPRYYYGYGDMFTIAWPSDTNRLLDKQWKSRLKEDVYFRVFMYSPQYFEQIYNLGKVSTFLDIPCTLSAETKSYNRFKWKGILIQIYAPISVNNPNKTLSLEERTPELRKDLCLTALKILNDEIKEVHYVR
ncbi:hypothetical protein [Acinetobacter boissieri]|uniref:Uncharacterized protein n=1 Tax=Acinetobacter boissieri TaxID=1219383 RepID=A0A1G6ITU9_9GAMM|nr:hypothetical protein [Acinetobacter boissieri]SDC09196.1 hypothetical protein SAMN05421733_10917 [Acinetobacter boissieri]